MSVTVHSGKTITVDAGDGTVTITYGGPQGAKGDTGDTGATGAKITSAAFDGNNLVFTLDDSSTVTLTDAKLTLKGDTGAAGTDGTDGDNAYVYIAYASDASGTDFTTTFNAALYYIAIKATTTAIPSPQASDFTGLWMNYKGAQGDPGGEGNSWAIQEVPSGTQNGSNKSFTLAQTPAGVVAIYFNGQQMRNGVDYSYTGTALTLITFAPSASEGDWLAASYPYTAA